MIALLILSLVVTWLPGAERAAVAGSCQEAQEILGLTLQSVVETEAEAAPRLVITDVAAPSQGAEIGLRPGDIVEQVNSWRAQDCESYSRAVQEAQGEHKALLLLVTRKGQHHAFIFEPEVWPRREQVKKVPAAEVTLQRILSAPLPPGGRAQARHTGVASLAILHAVAAVAVLPGDPTTYEQAVATAKGQLAALAQASQSEAERWVTAGAQVVLGYYLTAQEIRQYKHDLVTDSHKGLRALRGVTPVPSEVPYLPNSPVPGWLDKYPFLRACVRASPQKLNFIERAGRWDPDQAVPLLWEQAQTETDTFAHWLQD